MAQLVGTGLPGQWSSWLSGQRKKPVRGINGKLIRKHLSEGSELEPFRCDIFSLPLPILFPGVQASLDHVAVAADEAGPIRAEQSTASRGMTCLTCRLTFATLDEQFAHFKTELHRHNLGRKIKGEAPFDEEQFQFFVQNKKSGPESDEEAASSGESDESEKEAEDEDEPAPTDNVHRTYHDSHGNVTKNFNAKSGSMFHFGMCHAEGWKLSLSSALFPSDSAFADSRRWFEPDNHLFTACYQQLVHLRKHPMIAVLILRSGRFSGAIFDDSRQPGALVAHKAFRRYTVRAKAGGGQSSHDKAGGKARSAGAMLRRYGEKALEEDVQNLLTSWVDYLDSCGLILIATTKTMRPMLFDSEESKGLTLLRKDDHRVVGVPFAVDKPTLASAEYIHSRVIQAVFSPPSEDLHDICTILEEEEQEAEAAEAVAVKEKAEAVIPSLPPCLPSQQLIVACETMADAEICKVIDDLHSKCTEGDGHVDEEGHDWTWATIINYPNSMEDLSTALHIASRRGLIDTIESLLELGANPEREDVRGRTAYFLCGSKEGRNAFRRARALLGEEAWNWSITGVPEALTDEKVKLQRAKDKEKKKRSVQRKKEQKVRDELAIQDAMEMKAAEAVAKEMEKKEQEERQKQLAGQCPICAKSLYKHDFFDVLDQRCCSTECVAKLRRKLAAEAAMQRFAINK